MVSNVLLEHCKVAAWLSLVAARQMLECSAWLLGCCKLVAWVFRMVAKVLNYSLPDRESTFQFS